jgi:hypothetical protein
MQGNFNETKIGTYLLHDDAALAAAGDWDDVLAELFGVATSRSDTRAIAILGTKMALTISLHSINPLLTLNGSRAQRVN